MLLEQQQSDELPGGSSDPGRDSHDASQDHLHGASEKPNGPVSGPDQKVPATVFAEGTSQDGDAAARGISNGQHMPNGVLTDGEGPAPQGCNEGRQPTTIGEATGGVGVHPVSEKGTEHETASHTEQVADGMRPEQGSNRGPEAAQDGPTAMNEDNTAAVAPSDTAQPAER